MMRTGLSAILLTSAKVRYWPRPFIANRCAINEIIARTAKHDPLKQFEHGSRPPAPRQVPASRSWSVDDATSFRFGCQQRGQNVFKKATGANAHFWAIRCLNFRRDFYLPFNIVRFRSLYSYARSRHGRMHMFGESAIRRQLSAR
ncbi:hypothetical protein Bphy_6917 (plasmid) [Paraburkholderia phymatum STM815]|uniref:Uncharacterized protein n=1 Tax=Paraburkholderia phymatum (strain DSM 17167 / CIP 108236 / LMG 21445 / STM815) TaxID=391038 RepID=B2JTM5_PARP8|nr:hypothetical protein Bphy_6917 [Paraburkholderia phymatum STM815]